MNTSATADMHEQKIRQDWKKTKATLRNPDSDNNVPNSQRKTALDKLTSRYRSFVLLECLCLILIPFVIHWFFDGSNGTFLAMYAIVFFIIAVLVDNWLARKIASIDIQEMPVTSVVRTALDCRKRHIQSMVILLPLAIGFIALMAYIAFDEIPMLIGMAVGFAIGLALGIREFRAFMHDYRTAVADFDKHD